MPAKKSWERNGLTENEKQYWEKQASMIRTPYRYEYPWRGMNRFIDYTYDFIELLPLAAAACLCGLFSEDRRFRVSPLIFSSKNSRFPLYPAKILACHIYSGLRLYDNADLYFDPQHDRGIYHTRRAYERIYRVSSFPRFPGGGLSAYAYHWMERASKLASGQSVWHSDEPSAVRAASLWDNGGFSGALVRVRLET